MKWFKTWDVPKYKEWAKKTNYGYLLVIINQEINRFRCAKAKLVFKKNNLPEFILLEENLVKTEKEAENQIKNWK